VQHRDVLEWHKELTSWLDRSKCHRSRRLVPRSNDDGAAR
jgi:hypothetical protein